MILICKDCGEEFQSELTFKNHFLRMHDKSYWLSVFEPLIDVAITNKPEIADKLLSYKDNQLAKEILKYPKKDQGKNQNKALEKAKSKK
jgi:hypothetical protein